MKRKYKKPNICAIDFDILDVIYTSDPFGVSHTDEDDEWLFSYSPGNSTKSNGGFDGIGWY